MSYMYTVYDHIPVRVLPDDDGRTPAVQVCHSGKIMADRKDMFHNKFKAALALAERYYASVHHTQPAYQTESYDKIKPGDTVYVITDNDIALGHVETVEKTHCRVFLRTLPVPRFWCRKLYPDFNTALLAARDEIHAGFSRYVSEMDSADAIYDFVINHVANPPHPDGTALMALHYALMCMENDGGL